MNIYLITPIDSKGGWDTYDSFVVVSKSAKQAILYHPRHGLITDDDHVKDSSEWPYKPEELQAELVGKASKGYKEGEIICDSFNAG